MKFKTALLVLLAVFVLFPFVSSAEALCLGIAFGILVGNPHPAQCKKWASKCLAYSIVGLGASMNLLQVLKAGAHGFLITLIGIIVTLSVGALLGKVFRVDPTTSTLINTGTAICGGSAIAAVSQAIDAPDESTSMALATVFLLNAVALIIFPTIGHHLGLSQNRFGLWSAIAIHDTSSVVGAAAQFGETALKIATTTKLVRALWIIPVTLFFSWRLHRGESAKKPKFPLFILGFLAAAALTSFIPALHDAGALISGIARRTIVLALFLIGTGLSQQTLKKVGLRPCLQGVTLWAFVSVTSFFALALFQ